LQKFPLVPPGPGTVAGSETSEGSRRSAQKLALHFRIPGMLPPLQFKQRVGPDLGHMECRLEKAEVRTPLMAGKQPFNDGREVLLHRGQPPVARRAVRRRRPGQQEQGEA